MYFCRKKILKNVNIPFKFILASTEQGEYEYISHVKIMNQPHFKGIPEKKT